MIPALEDGVLPEGIHDCTIDEIEDRFGRIQGTDWRCTLTKELREYVAEVRKCDFIKAIIVDGSYVTAKDEPGDIDILVVVATDFDLKGEMSPTVYNLTNKRGMKRQFRFHFDLAARTEGSDGYNQVLDLYCDVKAEATYTTKTRKGVLRVLL